MARNKAANASFPAGQLRAVEMSISSGFVGFYVLPFWENMLGDE